ncbi:MAG: winged helix-turn-helix transcriptional regulator [Longimicrobiales bacterium]
MSTTYDPNRKCYGQICAVTTALDVAGDRWTLLILRELLGGPARFEELVDGLPGIARNLLSSRLRRLEGDGVVRRVDAQGASLYAVTELGAAARRAIEELGFWGVRLSRVAPAVHARSIRAVAMALHAILSRAGEALPNARYLIELDVEGEHVEVLLGPEPTAAARLSTEADARIRVPRGTISAVLLGRPFDGEDFTLLSGDPAVIPALLKAMRAPFKAIGQTQAS